VKNNFIVLCLWRPQKCRLGCTSSPGVTCWTALV